MKKTAWGDSATNLTPSPINDRRSGLYHVQETMESSNQEEPSWVRKGHTRKPNRVVRGLYILFDLIADFGPMIGWIVRLIKSLIVGTWGLLVRFFLGTVNIAILAGILFVSVGHSHDMLIRAGMSGIAAWVFVGVWETVFIYCSIVIDSAYRRGKEAGWAAWTGFVMGWLFVEISNIMGMADNWLGIGIGFATPVLLLVMKKVFQNQFGKETVESDSKKVSGNREEVKLEKSSLENLETSHLEKPEGGDLETSKLETGESSNLENLESGELENPPAMEGGDLEEVKLETSKLETGELKTSRLEEVKLEGQEKLETGDLETSDQKPEEKPEESITNWKLKTLQPALEKQVEPAPLKDSALEGEPLEDGKREAGELEKPESGDLENLETSKLEAGELEKLETPKLETGELEKLEDQKPEAGGSKKLETPKLEKPESGELEGEKQKTSKVENQEEEKFTKEDLKYFSREELEAMEGADPEDVAVQILERQGKLPGRDRLKRLTKCSEWDARTTLHELKKELKKNAS